MLDSVWKVPALHDSAAIRLGRFKGCSTLSPDGALFPITADTTRECFAALISWRKLRCVLGQRHLVKTAPIFILRRYMLQQFCLHENGYRQTFSSLRSRRHSSYLVLNIVAKFRSDVSMGQPRWGVRYETFTALNPT